MEKDQHIVFCLTEDDFKKTFSSLIGDFRRIFIVHGHKSYQSCGAKALIDELADALEVVDFSDFTENPKIEDVKKGVTSLHQHASELIVGIGGGSAMDMAKLIRHYARREVRLLAIPTTAGTGAESTQFAVCYIDGEKHSVSDSTILPDDVILYPPFTYNNGRYLTSCTGFDALAQAIEAFWNINSTFTSRKH